MSFKRPFECPYRWVVVSGSPTLGFTFHGPFKVKREAEYFRDDWIAWGAEAAEVAKLYDPRCDDSIR